VSLQLFTIGFAGTSAAHFFGLLRSARVKRLIDVRLNNTSQLAGFTKMDDLRFFLREICNVEYRHEPLLAPTQDMLDAYKKLKGSWQIYEREFNDLMATRSIEKYLSPESVDLACLLCSEKKAEHCHRRLVAEYLQHHWSDVAITHLV
jgi:uncharacterized protein (DUF488 family)